ncbi:MAG: MarR family transcriptional regulator [Candidatus Bruticola sp.]
MRRTLSRDFMDLVRHFAYHEKQVHVYGVKEPLYRSEIHVVWLVGAEPGLYGLKLAKKIGITKSAASQILSKLEKRGMISSRVAADKLTKREYTLTEEGWKVFAFHEELHREFEKRFNAFLRRYTPEQRKFLKGFVQDLNNVLNLWFTDDLYIL